MERSLLLRELGRQQRDVSLNADATLVRRMQQSSLDGHIAAVTSCAFNDNGTLLVSSGDDTLIKLWDVHRGKAIHSFDSGHSQSIGCVRFLPDCGSTRVVTGSADKQVRLVDLERAAIKPFAAHRAKVRALTAVSRDIILSAAEDGRVRRMDAREAAPPRSASRAAAEDFNSRSLLVEQRMEVPHAATRMGIHSLAHDPMQPYYFATGGEDSLVRVYDMRYLRAPGTGGPLTSSRSPTWAFCLVPTHLAPPRSHPSPLVARRCQITGLAYSHTGHYLLASYSHEHIYSFNVKQHAQSRDALLAALSTYNASLGSTSHWGPGSGGARGGGGGGGGAGDEGSDFERFAMWAFEPQQRGGQPARGGSTRAGRASGSRRAAGNGGGGTQPHTGNSPGSAGSAAAHAHQPGAGPSTRSRLQPGAPSRGQPGGGVTTRARAGGVHQEPVRSNAMRAAPGTRPSAWLATIAEEPGSGGRARAGGAASGSRAGAAAGSVAGLGDAGAAGGGGGGEEAQRQGRRWREYVRAGTRPWALPAHLATWPGRRSRSQQQQQGTEAPAQQQDSVDVRRRLRARRHSDPTTQLPRTGEEGLRATGEGEEEGDEGAPRAPVRQLSQDSSRIAQMCGDDSEGEVQQRGRHGQREQEGPATGAGGGGGGSNEHKRGGSSKAEDVKQEAAASPAPAQGFARRGHQLTPPKLKSEKTLVDSQLATIQGGATTAEAAHAPVKDEQENDVGGAGGEGSRQGGTAAHAGPSTAAPPESGSRPRRRGRTRGDDTQPTKSAADGAGKAGSRKAPGSTAVKPAPSSRRSLPKKSGVRKRTATTARPQTRQQGARLMLRRNLATRTVAPPDDSSTSSATSDSEPHDPQEAQADILGAGALAAHRRAELSAQVSSDDDEQPRRPFMLSVTRHEPGTSSGGNGREGRRGRTGHAATQAQPQQQPASILRHRGRSATGATAGQQVASTAGGRRAGTSDGNRGARGANEGAEEGQQQQQQQQQQEAEPDMLIASGEDAAQLLQQVQQAAGAVAGPIQLHLTVAHAAPQNEVSTQEEGGDTGVGGGRSRRRRRLSEDGGPLLRPQAQRRRLRSSPWGPQAAAGSQPPGDSSSDVDDSDGGSGNEGPAPAKPSGPSNAAGPSNGGGDMAADREGQPQASGRRKRGRAAAAGNQHGAAGAGDSGLAPSRRSHRTRRVTFADMSAGTTSSSSSDEEPVHSGSRGVPVPRKRLACRGRRSRHGASAGGDRAGAATADDETMEAAAGPPSAPVPPPPAGGGLRLLREHIISSSGAQRRAGLDLPPRPPAPPSSTTSGPQQPTQPAAVEAEGRSAGAGHRHDGEEEQQHTDPGGLASGAAGSRRSGGPRLGMLSLHLSPRVVNPNSSAPSPPQPAAAAGGSSRASPRAGSDEAYLRSLAPAQAPQQGTAAGAAPGATAASPPAAAASNAAQAGRHGPQGSGAGGTARASAEDGQAGLVTGLLRGAVRWAPLPLSGTTAGAAPAAPVTAPGTRRSTRSGTRRVGMHVWGGGPSDSSSEAEGSEGGEGRPGPNNGGPSHWDPSDPPLDVPGQGRHRRRAREARRRALGEGSSQGGQQGQEQGGGEDAGARGYHQVFKGHSNRQSVKEVTWLGGSSQFVASGSDEGGIHIWDATTGRTLSILRPTPLPGAGTEPGEGDTEGSPLTAACIAAHPTQLMLAACGSGRSVRIWTPTADVPAPLPQPEAVQEQHNAVAAAAVQVAAATAAEAMVFQIEQWMARVHMQGVQEELEQHRAQSRAMLERLNQILTGLRSEGAPGAGLPGNPGQLPEALVAAIRAGQAAVQAAEGAVAAIHALAAAATVTDVATIAVRADAALQGVREAAAEAEAANQRMQAAWPLGGTMSQNPAPQGRRTARRASAPAATVQGAAGASGSAGGGGEGAGQQPRSWASRLQGLLRRRSFGGASGGGSDTPAPGAQPSSSPGSVQPVSGGEVADGRVRVPEASGAGPSNPRSPGSTRGAGAGARQGQNPGRGAAGSGGAGDDSRASASSQSPGQQQGTGLMGSCHVM